MSEAHSLVLGLLSGHGPAGRDVPEAEWQQAVAAWPALQPMLAFEVERQACAAPAAIRQALTAARRDQAVVHVQRMAALRPAFTALDAGGVSFVVLKGLPLAYQAYPSPETRVMSDVDLWLEPGRKQDALDALAPLGWHKPPWRAPLAGETEASLQFGDTKVLLELHDPPHSLAHAMPSAMPALWERRVRADLGGVSAWVLPPEETLMHLSVHLAEHHRFMAALSRLLDITLLLRRAGAGIDWPSFAARCRRYGIAGWVATSLGVARRLLGAPVTDGSLAAFGIADLDRLCELGAEQAVLKPRAGTNPTSVLMASSPAAAARRLGSRLARLVADDGANDQGGRTHRTMQRLSFAARVNLPGLLRTLWLSVTRPAEGARLRGRNARNDQLYRMLRDVSRTTEAA